MGRYAKKGSNRWAELRPVVLIHAGQVVSNTLHAMKSYQILFLLLLTSLMQAGFRCRSLGHFKERNRPNASRRVTKDRNYGAFDKISSFGKWALFDRPVSCARILRVGISY